MPSEVSNTPSRPYSFEAHGSEEPEPRSVRLWNWLGGTIPSGTGWMLYGRWSWQRRFGGWWLSWWGWAFFYSRPWRPGSFDG